ncbi:pentatricopeptide repeat-containing protein At4g02750-like [Selaginella moellendorffii]|uniref:pentatricopeptide repeat-containing protein At4g02750-like n=1 Tax=Selaginella moellendorffii TaxID=88036 RepID=UPI000D1C74EA|nr:pentatricopeptide repeat-containing protein At4g02750-like [Selaginella moellendorffii]|eukprot:XP_024532930.1 pentatricopeptide repeat-containing protein At4g02750-like [Selaginella moellendorffii]
MRRQLPRYDRCDEPLERSVPRLERREIAADKATIVALLARCIQNDALWMGRRVHAQISRAGRDGEAFIGNHLVEMYGKCGSISGAHAAFEAITARNPHSWNIMISAYAQNGHLEEAQVLFDEMPEKNVISWNTMLAAHLGVGNLDRAMAVFHAMPERDSISWNTLITAFAEAGHLSTARSLLAQMPDRSVSSWNAMITGYARSGDGRSALQLFSAMDLEGQRANIITLVVAIGACQDVDATLSLHSSLAAPGLDSDAIVASALVAAYGRHGSVENAQRCFDGITRKDVVAWTVILTAYAQNGHAREALRVFQLMNLDGAKPCKVTLLAIFHACASDASAAPFGRTIHSSLAGTGMDYDVSVGTALVDMYGNAGSLEEARSAFAKIARKNVVSWTAIIAANAQNGHSREALELFREMLVEGVKLNEITVLSALSACSRAGLVEDGHSLFAGVESDYHFSRNLEHYQCAIDLLGRAGHVELAAELMSSMPFQPGSVASATLVAACHTHGNLEQGLRAATGGGSLIAPSPGGSSGRGPGSSGGAAAAAVLISNIYSTSL